MIRISIGQILVLCAILFLLFGDLQLTKKRLTTFIKQLNDSLFKKNRKKGF